jgi:hypothetical protein
MPPRTRFTRFLCALGFHYTEPVPRGVMRIGGVCEWCGRVSYHDDIGGVFGILARMLYLGFLWGFIVFVAAVIWWPK